MKDGQAEETPLETGQEATKAPDTETEVVDPMFAKLGFKSNEAAARSLEEAKVKISTQGQEISTLKQSFERPPAQVQVTDDDHFENPVKTTEIVAKRVAQKEMNDFKWDLAAKTERDKDPAEFNTLIPYMNKVGQLEPYLNNNPLNMPDIVSKARAMRKEEINGMRAELLDGASPEELLQLNLTKTGVSEAEKLANLSVGSTSIAAKQTQTKTAETADAAMDDIFGQTG